MRVQVFQHVPFEGLGSIQQWLDARNASVAWTRFYEPQRLTERLPELADVDLLIVLGGPMSVNDEATLPWLVEEKHFIASAIAAGKPVLGICLGAQLIANALGARVYPNKQKEIGWFEVEATSSHPDNFHFPTAIDVFHWHGETFDLPEGARHLARSQVCENQAFQFGKRVIALQFHLETTPESAESMFTHCRDELVDGETIQTEAAMREVSSASYNSINALMEAILNYITRPAH
ncbi:MAG: type 1 glutamine amidotransferase [Oxalobacter sp.]|nr:MAG: type 1 glutamine amidotransferase [Oxalobacter sp.]